MARTPKAQNFTKKTRAPSRKTSNALGYAKRQAQKDKRPSRGDVEDVYEYQQEKVRRSKVKLQYEREELIGAHGDGSDEEDEDGAAGHRRKGTQPRLIGEGDEDERIAEDEDEDIDSDAAFDESDEERFAGFGFSQKKGSKTQPKKKRNAPGPSRAVRLAEVDLNEDEASGSQSEDEASEASDNGGDDEGESEEEEEEGDPDEFIDVLDVLDGRGEPESGDEKGDAQQDRTEVRRTKHASAKSDDGPAESAEDEEMRDVEEDEEESDEDDDDEEELDQEVSASEGEDEGGDASALDDLQRFVTSLDAGQKRKSPEAEDGEPRQRAKKRRLLPERTEAGEENEFAAHLASGKLQLDDLLAPLAGQSSNLQSLKKSAKILTSQSGPGKTLAAPLPQRTAERLDREAAYEQTKEEVDKWKATMQRIKEAEHLSFPLQAQPASKTSNLELAAKFKPTTELESAVDKLLKSAKMRDEDIAQTESLKMNHLSVEEVKARRAELAKMRELMFRAEAKAKRVAKIKSKTYRRLKKKEKAKLAAKLGEGESDVDEDDEVARLKREIERARERATLRHKNTGKWAKAMKGRGELDVDQRKEIAEMLDRGERLRRKIQGGDSDEESDDDSGDDEDAEYSAQRIKASAFEELAGLEDAGGDAPVEEGKKGKSIFEMKFMKDAMTREQRKVNEEVDDFVKEMGGQIRDADADGEGAAEEEGDPTYGASVQRVGGRVIYRPGPPGVDSLRPTGSLASDTSSVTLKSTDLPGPSQPTSPVATSPTTLRPVPLPTAEEVNPWLARVEDVDRPMQKRHEVTVNKNSASADKSKNKLRKRKEKREEAKEKAKQDAAVDISMSSVMTLGDSTPTVGPSKQQKSAAASKAKGSKSAQSSKAQPTESDDESDANSEVEDQEKLLADPKGKGKGKANGVKAFQQRDLVALAFAGDNVVQDFAEAKRREQQEDAPKEVNTTLPGWGAWGGKGARRAPPKSHLIKKVAGIDPTTRADYGKAHVIISEKRDKKAVKYTVKDLPFPYTSKAQFERSLETPLGVEWNTRMGFQRATLPRVVTKPGQIIAPLEKQHA